MDSRNTGVAAIVHNDTEQDDILREQIESARAIGNLQISFHGHIRLANAVLVRLAARTQQLYEPGTSNSQTKALLADLDLLVAEIRQDVVLAEKVTTTHRPATSPLDLPDCSLPKSASSCNRFLPMLPLSSLTRKLAASAQRYHVANAKYQQTSHAPAGDPSSLTVMRKLLEDTNIERDRLTQIQAQMDTIATSSITAFSAANLALHMASVSVDLFSSIPIQLELQSLASFESVGDHTRHCLDWHQYLKHMAISAIVLCTSNSVFGDLTINRPGALDPPTNDHARAAAIENIVSTICHLTYVYRNLECSTALLEALQCPSVQHLRKSWKLVRPEILDQYTHFVDLLGYEGLLDLLSEMIVSHQHATSLQPLALDSTSNIFVVAVPCMHHAVAALVDMRNAFGTDSSGLSTLSEMGTQKMQDILSLMHACQSNSPYSPSHISSTGKVPVPSSIAQPIPTPMPKMDIPLPLSPKSLSNLPAPNEALTHWLLTRVYHDMSVLQAHSFKFCSGVDGDGRPDQNGGDILSNGTLSVWDVVSRAYKSRQIALLQQRQYVERQARRLTPPQPQSPKQLQPNVASLSLFNTSDRQVLSVGLESPLPNTSPTSPPHDQDEKLDGVQHPVRDDEAAFDASLLDRFARLTQN
ncbi:hypothetical protein BASA61_002400 [Batrachochytrium salamandrivorans]|nr:hypothetical protein BASA62_003743 [Batrachochytrium salamandrivorans]KAH6599988.1 hypothetical protein BASA61_002400 [Batrachochytrium salamandrivorans]